MDDLVEDEAPLTEADLKALRQLNLTSCDFCGDSGCCDPTCWRCHSPVGPEHLRALAKNLEAAAILCRAWQLGWGAGISYPRMDGAPKWRPGCGSEAP